jgi:PAS domain S-box-containing protein
MALLVAFLENTALLALAAVLLHVFIVRVRLSADDWRRQLFIGVILGGVAALVILLPVIRAGGAIFDMRAGPLMVAGLFAGPVGAAVAAVTAGAARLWVGGAFALGGVLSVAAYALSGVLMTHMLRRIGERPGDPLGLLALGLLGTALGLPCFFVGVPIEIGGAALGQLWPALVGGNVLGTLLMGLFLAQFVLQTDARSESDRIQAISESARKTLGIGVWGYDFATDRLTWDMVTQRIFGIDPETFSGKLDYFWEQVHPADRERVAVAFERAHEAGKSNSIAYRIRTPAGEERYVHSHFTFSGLAGGKAESVFGVVLDESAENTLRGEVARNTAALEAATCGVTIAEAGGDLPLVYVNRAFVAMTGYEPQEVIGRNCRFLNRDAADRETRTAIREALAAGREVHTTVRNRRKDGTFFWNALRVSPIRDDSGIVTHFVGIQQDVTEQVELQRSLEETNETLKAILNVNPDAILTVDKDQRITSFNPAAEELFGWPRRAVLGRRIDVLIPTDKTAGHADKAAAYIADPQAVSGGMAGNRVLSGLRRDGTVFPVAVSLARYERHGEPAVVATARDMTDVVRANEELQSLSEELRRQLVIAEEASEAKSRFLANMSHELRTPLNAIIGFAELLKMRAAEQEKPDGSSEYLDLIRDSGQHLLLLINDILDLARIESEGLDVELERADPCELIKAAVAMADPLAQRKSIRLQTDLPVRPAVYCDRRAMQQSLLNLISNAVKYSEAGTTVRISASEHAGEVAIAVSDEGLGIDPSLIDSIGKPFLRAADPIVASEEGTGLGLAITKALMERQGGRLTLTRGAQGGTVATLWLSTAPALAEAL